MRRRRTVNIKDAGRAGARNEQASLRTPAERASQSDSIASGAGVKPLVSDSFAPRSKRDLRMCFAPRERPRTQRLTAGLSAGFCLLLVLGGRALAAEQTRESYLAAVEPICKTNKAASDRYLRGVRGLVKDDKLKKAGENFSKAAAALEKAQKQLAAVEQPPADSAKLTKWLQGIEAEVALMRTIAAKLKAGKSGPASSLSVRLTHDATTTNNQVIVFQFNYCRIDPSRYT
jgi:hypothetical protein